MSILIKGIDMPKSCGECEFNYNLEGGSYEWWECVILHDDINQFDTRRTGCPLIEIVRCGECKHLKADGTCDIFADDNIRPSVSDFCSYGERRNDE